MPDTPEHLRYTAEHEWLDLDGDTIVGSRTATVGVTAYAVDQLGDVVFVGLPHVGQRVDAGSPVGEVESTKSVSDLYTPVTGTVTEVNEALADDPSLVNSDPYADGWLFRLAINATVDGAPPALLSAAEYLELVEGGS